MDFSKLEWVVKMLEVIGNNDERGANIRRVIYTALAVAFVYALSALVMAIRWW